jgi:SAM-dependent methyltransferase
VDARAGTAEAIPSPDGSVDAVFVGQAFHWFRTAEACREIARVLSAGGGLGLLWNRARRTETDLPWLALFDALVKPHRRAAGPSPAEGDLWRLVLDATGLFARLSCVEVDSVQRLSADGFVALVASWSWTANLPDYERVALLRHVRELAGGRPRLTRRYRTEIYWTRRADA